MIFTLYDNGFPRGDEIWFYILFGSLGLVNLTYVVCSPSSPDDEGIIALWIRVKKVELRKRLN